MLISAASPQALIDWFHAKQEHQKIMCVMLAPGTDDQKKLESLTQNLYHADAVLGSEVAFILLHPKMDGAVGLDVGRYGEVAAFPGLAFPPRDEGRGGHRELAFPLRETSSFRDLSDMFGNHRSQIATTTSRAMARFAQDFMAIFNIKVTELPCLCMVVKGVDESIVLNLKPAWTPDQLMELLAQVRTIVDDAPDYRAKLSTMVALVPRPMERLQEVVREIKAKELKIAEIFDQVLLRHSGNEDDRRSVEQFVAQGCAGTENLRGVLERLSFESSARFERDGQIRRLLTLVKRLDEVRAPLIALTQSRDSVSYTHLTLPTTPYV